MTNPPDFPVAVALLCRWFRQGRRTLDVREIESDR
jgi:hypothetical protein